QLIAWFKKQMADLNIPIQFGTEITDLTKLNADAIVVATGSVAKRLPIPGAERAMTAVEYLLGEKEVVGDNVVIIGGGLTGCGIALDLHKKGKNPQIVEMMNDLMAVKNLCLANSSFLRDYFKCYDVPVFLESGVKEIGDDYVIVEGKDKVQTKLPADTIIMSVGYNPTPLVEPGYNLGIGPVNVPVPDVCAPVVKKVDEIVKELLGPLVPVNNETTVGGKTVYTIGDASKVANIKAAIWGAWDVAMKV
ncbi:MAG: FAD-dependent oxidoreductase, partial [Clostridia bacterium]|nr:FAD-dependent oxidoreductase [Clostridia bacterium]